MLGLRPKDDFRFCFVTDFPQFEWSEEEGRYLAMHHPFTMPYEEDLPYLLTDPGRVRAQSYDVVLNGVELGSGSIRIHRSDVQALMFKALGFSEEDARERFGFLIDAFRYGTPPHGGFAFGLDRLVMLLLGADSLRDVIAFPKVKDASCPMTGAPDFVDPAQLEVLKLGVARGHGGEEAGARRRTRHGRAPGGGAGQAGPFPRGRGAHGPGAGGGAGLCPGSQQPGHPGCAHDRPRDPHGKRVPGGRPRAVHGPGSAAGLRSRPHPGMRGRAPNVRVRRVAPWKS